MKDGVSVGFGGDGCYLMVYVQKIPLKVCPRRQGDAVAVYASTEKAERELGWK